MMNSINIKKIFPVVFFSILCYSCRGSVNDSITNPESTPEKIITFVFAGDIMSHSPQVAAAYLPQSNSYDFSPCFRFVKLYIEQADLAVANLEAPLAGKPYSGYPFFSMPDEMAIASIDAGFDVLLTANNHAADKGKKGLFRTLAVLSGKVKHTGSFENIAQRDSIYPLIVNVKGLKTAVLNCTYDLNGNILPEPALVNLIDTTEIEKDIKTAKERGAEFIIMCIHWGNEYTQESSFDQKNLAQFMANEGVNLIIGSHPHVVQEFNVIYGKDSIAVPVFYSLGNLLSNQRERYKNGGVLAKVEVNSGNGKIVSCTYMPLFLYKGILNGKYQYYLLQTPDYISDKIAVKLNKENDFLLKQFDADTKQRLQNINEWQ